MDTLPASADRDALEAALAASPADQTEIVLLRDVTALTRYANSEIHQNVRQENSRAAVRVAVGGSTARVFTNAVDQAGLESAIAEAVALARLQAPNPRFHSLPAPGSGTPPEEPEPPCYFLSTAHLTPAARSDAVGAIVDAARAAGFTAYGTYSSSASSLSVVNSLGIRAHAPYTAAYLKVLVEGSAGSGFADALSRDAATLDPAALAADAIARCRLNHDQIELPPGDYAAVFEPNAVADMVRFPVITGLGAQEYLDGQSFLSGHLGEQVSGPEATLWDDPRDPRCMPLPIDGEGLPAVRVPLLQAGYAMGVVYDSLTAGVDPGHRSTGHAPLPFDDVGDTHPLPGHVVMPTGEGSAFDLARDLDRGILVTRFHYTGCPDHQRVIATGTTRDGTFLVERGEIVAAVRNMRLGMPVLDLLAGIEARGAGKTCRDWWAMNGMGSTYYYLPALRFARVTFTGVTTF